MQGNFGTLAKNVKNFIPGTIAFLAGASPAYATWSKLVARQKKFAPKEFNDGYEVFSPEYGKRFHDQEKNFWVDHGAKEEVSRAEIAHLMSYKVDLWRMMHSLAPFACLGGYAAPWAVMWLGTNSFVPSTFNATDEEIKEWRVAQDNLRFKFAPSYLADQRFFFDHHVMLPERANKAWDDLYAKNNVRRDPTCVTTMGKIWDSFMPLLVMRRRSLRALTRASAFPSFPFWSRLCHGTRLRDYWMLALTEDYMVITDKLVDTMTDAELYDYAWRRFLAPYEANLSREELVRRVSDYHVALGPDFLSGKTPCLQMLWSYCMGYYNEPAFLEGDIAELEKNDYDHLDSWGKDAFLRRLEFENGPLRDQVEAHTQKLLEQRKQAAAAAAPVAKE